MIDQSKEPLYAYMTKEESKENIFRRIIIAPTLNLTLSGTPRHPEVHCPDLLKENAWWLLIKAFKGINPKREEASIENVFEGFEGYQRTGDQLYYRAASYFEEGQEKERIIRLMLRKPSMGETFRYSSGWASGSHDRYDLKAHIICTLQYINESWGGDRSPCIMGYTEAAKIQLARIGKQEITKRTSL